MQLTYFHGRQLNFGDDLNALLWPSLLPGMFGTNGSRSSTGFLGIGTIIGMPTPGIDYLHVFSSGVGYDTLAAWTLPRRVWCVRGPLSARMMDEDADCVLTDGAILTPEVVPRSAAPEAALGGDGHVVVVPHWESLRYPGWQQSCDLAGYDMVSPINTPGHVIDRLCRATLVLTESLHGAILADTYGIPWVPLATTRNLSTFKWTDWCLSVGLDYAPVAIPPPCAAAAIAFGQPDRGGWGVARMVDGESAAREFLSRTDRPRPLPEASTPAYRLRPMLREAAEAITTRSSIASRALSFSADRTASYLAAAARLAPCLSRQERRDGLTSRMLDRLAMLARIDRPGTARAVIAPRVRLSDVGAS